MSLKTLQKKTAELEAKFPHRMGKRALALDLMEEVGELSQAMLIVEEWKKTSDPNKQRTVEDVANALGDIMFDLLVMADKYGLNMEMEYEKVLEELENRYREGEFGGVK